MGYLGTLPKKLLTVVSLAFLVLSLALAQFGYLASGNMMFPEQPPMGIHITSSGLVEGTDKIQASGNTYTLTEDIEQSISILRDGVVLDGAGYTLRGSGSGVGVFLQERNRVTIKNLKIENFNYGIKMTWLSYGGSKSQGSISIEDNSLNGNKYGIAFFDNSAVTISGNRFEGNTYAAYSPSGVVFRDNQFSANDYCIHDDHAYNDVDPSNTVNDKPMYYWVGQQDKAVPSDAGWVTLKNCKNINVEGLNLDRCGDGLTFFNTSFSTVKGNLLTNNANGLRLFAQSDNNTIIDNTISGSSENGVSLSSASNNTILKNQIFNNAKDGIAIDYFSYNNTINQNQITANIEAGVGIKGVFQNVRITFPNFNSTNFPLQHASLTDNTVVSQNSISNNGMGMWIDNRESLTIVLNNITGNIGWGIKLEGSQRNNIIHHNNFVSNNIANATEQLQVCIAGFFNSTFNPKPNSTYTKPDIAFVAGDTNVWDNGREGNYWSDYLTRYPNASETGKTGVGDTPFYINENNIDQHPLLAPIDITNMEALLGPEGTQSSQTQEGTFLSTVIIGSVATVVVFGVGVVVYFRKNKS